MYTNSDSLKQLTWTCRTGCWVLLNTPKPHLDPQKNQNGAMAKDALLLLVVAGALNFLWAIVPLQTLMSTKLLSGLIGVFWKINRTASNSAMRLLQPG